MTDATESVLSAPATAFEPRASRRYRVPPLPPILVVASDFGAVTMAWFLACALRLLLNPLFAKKLSFLEVQEVAPPLLAMLALWAVIELRDYMRGTEMPKRFGHGLLEVLERAFVAGFLAIVATFFSRSFGSGLSRAFVLLFLPVSFACLILTRYSLVLAARFTRALWPRSERIAVLGNLSNARLLAADLQRADPFCTVVGVIVDDQLATEQSLQDHPPQATQGVLGAATDLATVINTAHLNRIILTEHDLERPQLEQCASIAARMNVTMNLVVDVPSPALQPRIEHGFGLQFDKPGLGLLRLQPITRTPWQNGAKQAVDLILSSLALGLSLPVLAAIALAIRLTSPGPVLYRSRRVGKGGRHFIFLKFRSMYTAVTDPRDQQGLNEKSGHIFKMRNDPRVTTVGRWLRRTSLDELPQLINVLRGEMSLVGPRPLPARDLDGDGMSRTFAAWAEQRSRVLPGITGLWQIRGRSELPFEEMVRLDLQYIRAWSLRLDLRILLETPLALLFGGGAY